MTDALWRLARRILFLLAPETAHHVAMASLGLLLRVPGVRGWARRRLVVRDRRLETSVAGLRLPNPVGLAAGFDKDARWFEDLGVLGFGFVEIGTLTAHAQPGNPRPRLFRLPADRALINRMGFNNGGSAAAEPRLAARRPGELVVGANIGKSKVTPNDDALADYLQSYDRLARHADYVTVNVSSPNTAGLRDLQEANALRALLAGLLERVRAATEATGRHRPLFVKIAPDLDDDARDAIVDLAVELGLDGIVATNTTIDRSGLVTPRDVVDAI
ncbi:MAG: quinone-dependent dihydroorotate dehydrogenase, partial [Myxococcales bacterium]|nr:quinone-dependent dihydroorotate dehydrogenase [Myxococcales bacterium]